MPQDPVVSVHGVPAGLHRVAARAHVHADDAIVEIRDRRVLRLARRRVERRVQDRPQELREARREVGLLLLRAARVVHHDEDVHLSRLRLRDDPLRRGLGRARAVGGCILTGLPASREREARSERDDPHGVLLPVRPAAAPEQPGQSYSASSRPRG